MGWRRLAQVVHEDGIDLAVAVAHRRDDPIVLGDDVGLVSGWEAMCPDSIGWTIYQ